MTISAISMPQMTLDGIDSTSMSLLLNRDETSDYAKAIEYEELLETHEERLDTHSSYSVNAVILILISLMTLVAINVSSSSMKGDKEAVFTHQLHGMTYYNNDSSYFSLTSSEFNDYEFIPDAFTCAGAILDDFSNNPPLQFANAPEGTVEYFLTLSTHVVTPDLNYVRYDLCVWNISRDASELPTGLESGYDGARFCGTYSLKSNDSDVWADPYYHYSTPCSSGPGQKNYTFTLYALSGHLNDVLLDSVFNMTTEKDEELYNDEDTDMYTNSNITKANDMLGYLEDNDLILANSTLHFYYTRYKVVLYADDDPSSEPTTKPTYYPVAVPSLAPVVPPTHRPTDTKKPTHKPSSAQGQGTTASPSWKPNKH